MQITNKVATVMFTDCGAKALTEISLGARRLKDFKIGPGANVLLSNRNTSRNLTMIGQKARETLCGLLGTGLSMETEQRIDSILKERTI